jgi:hypothetical protein
MNILYIGPYRQNDIHGWTDHQIINHLALNNKFNIRCCPIYHQMTDILDITDPNIIRAENNKITNFDVIIQRADPKYLIKINKIQKNIAIPILNPEIPDKQTLDNLSMFDSVLTDSKLAFNKLNSYSSKLAKKIKNFDYNLSLESITKNKFNLGILNFTKKIYFIGNYKQNLTNIENICKAFIAHSKSKEYSLLLFLTNLDIQSKNNLEAMIKRYYSLHKINYTINRIIIIPIESTIENIGIAHQTGDFYLDIQDECSNTFNVKLATALGKNIIQYNIEDMYFVFDHNTVSKSSGFMELSVNAINKTIKNICGGIIPQPMPFKKQDINQLI